jgi:hypothetical protein
MKKLHLPLVILTATLAFACNNENKSKNDDVKVATNEDLAKRGKYLVSIMGCNDCHSPKVMTPQGPVPDTNLLLSGHPSAIPAGPVDTTTLKSWVLFSPMLTAAAGPWGVSFAANITSDESGIGSWSEAQFMKAIREGKYMGLDNGRMILPPMPWPVYAQATDEDLKAIFAYLKSTKPVHNIVPPPIPPKQG